MVPELPAHPKNPDQDARVIPFPSSVPVIPSQPLSAMETSYEWPLDDEEEISDRKPVYVDVVTREHDLRPIIPANLRGWDNIKSTVRFHTRRWLHIAGVHATRSPMYTVKASLWSVVGVFRLIGRQLRWWWHPELSTLLSEAATKADLDKGPALEKQLARRRSARGFWLALEVVALAVGVPLLVTTASWWVLALVAVVVVPYLAHVGRPVDRPIVTPAVVTGRFRKLTADIVLRAYYAAGLGKADKPDHQVTFGSPMARDGEGSRVLVDLPYGKGLDDAIKARGSIASGLDVAVSQVFITRDPSSHRRHVLWVADRDPLAIGAGRTPLLNCKPTDIWQPAPFGLNERGDQVTVPILWNSILVGAQPRQGKTFSARQLALYAALDPHAKLWVFDGKGSPDWRKFSLVADRYGFGLAMTRDGNPVEIFVQALRDLKKDVEDRYQRLSELPASICPEGKLTREIARDPKYRMPVHLVVIDEVQEYFDLGEDSKEIANLLMYLVKVAPAAGVSVLDATQKPSLPGSGPLSQAFNTFRDNHVIRFALRTGSYNVSDLVLGAGAYSEGHDSSELLPSYKGVGILRGASDDTPTVRTYLADQEDAEKILIAARALRERVGTLSGMAAGEATVRVSRDVLADVRGVYYAGEAFISWPQIAARLADTHPEAYADITADAISAQVRALGVESKDGRDKSEGGKVLKGAKLAQVEAAINRRAITNV